MITLDIAPTSISASTNPGLRMKTETLSDRQEKITVFDGPEGTMLGWAVQSPDARHSVRFFQGKGGFCAVIASDSLVYFVLPGGTVTLPGTRVELPGEMIYGKPAESIPPRTQTPPQTVTTQAMILGAGLATRFEPISGDTAGYPKPGIPLIGENTVITLIADHLSRHGFQKLFINTFYKPDVLKHQLAKAKHGLDITYIDETAPSGTAGGLAKALEQGMIDHEQPILIIQGDAITDADLSLLLNTHQGRNAAITIGGQIVPDRDVNKFGIIETDAAGDDGQSGHVTSFKEKPSLAEAGHSRFANAGFYVLAPEVFPLFLKIYKQKLAANQLFDYAQDLFPEVLQQLGNAATPLRHRRTGEPLVFWAQALGGYWSDIGNPTQYVESLRDITAGCLDIPLPANLGDYTDGSVIYWPGAKTLARSEGAEPGGNVIVGRSFSA